MYDNVENAISDMQSTRHGHSKKYGKYGKACKDKPYMMMQQVSPIEMSKCMCDMPMDMNNPMMMNMNIPKMMDMNAPMMMNMNTPKMMDMNNPMMMNMNIPKMMDMNAPMTMNMNNPMMMDMNMMKMNLMDMSAPMMEMGNPMAMGMCGCKYPMTGQMVSPQMFANPVPQCVQELYTAYPYLNPNR